ncbi:2-phosphoxylose phosphatase 1 isoform X2 [Genypterus blacodes]
MIRHGDRYPLYFIPKTKRPAIDCTLSTSRSPSHPLLNSFISHMGQGGRGHWESPLGSLPRLPNHSACEMGQLTQTGVVQHLRNGQLLHEAYKRHNLLPSDWSPRQVWVETTGKSRTLQSAMAFLYGFLPGFDWTKLTVRHQWSTLFCGSACDCPIRSKYLDEEQRRQYRFRVANAELERTYIDMARTLGLPMRQLRAANPIDSLLCHLCHGLPFPCVAPSDSGAGGCLTLAQFGVIRRQQLDDEVDRRRTGLYRKYAILASYPYLNRTAAKMERVARSNEAGRQPRAGGEEAFTVSSAHDVTMAPLLNALGLDEAKFPRFAARVVFELWKSPPATQGELKKRPGKGERSKLKDGQLFIKVLYNGEDVTFHTTFCRRHNRNASQPLCPLKTFLSFVRRDMFRFINATSYQEACYRRPG